MPLSYLKPIIKQIPLAQKAREGFVRATSIFRIIPPEMSLAILLLVCIILAFLGRRDWIFNIVVGIYIVCFFTERIMIIFNKKKTSSPIVRTGNERP
jgi:hypothetical protein